MTQYKLTTRSKKLLADTLTPVNIYLKLRDVYAGSILLESSDYHGHENSLSFICCNPISSFQVSNDVVEVRNPDGTTTRTGATAGGSVLESLDSYRRSFEIRQASPQKNYSGLFGYITYDAVRYFEDLSINLREKMI